jgi:restriction endonuclease Mrr
MMTQDDDIRAVRDVRERISAEFDDDPERLVAHYLAEQEKYRDRLLLPAAAQRGDAKDDASRRG